MPIFGEKPVTSITVKINQLATPNRNEDIDETIELYLSDLLQLIEVQHTSGAIEAARAIRKKIKYGDSVEVQLRALSILEMLVLNSGPRIGPVLARDDKLLDVLKGIMDGTGRTGLGTSYNKNVQSKVVGLARGWRSELAGMDDYKYMASLWKFIPRAKTHLKTHLRTPSNVFDEDVIERPQSPKSPPRKSPPPRPKAASPYSAPKEKKKKRRTRKGVLYADEQFRIPQINYKVEAPKIRATIADCLTHTTALNNTLIALPSGVNPLDDKKTSSEFDRCRSIRRKVLRYLQYVGAGDESEKSREVLAMDEEFLGSLIGANEQLVNVFKKFDLACGYTDANPAPTYDDEEDSEGYESYYTDEESEDEADDSISGRLQSATLGEGSSRAKSPPPPRPVKPAALSEGFVEKPVLARSDTNATSGTTESDPFGDSHEANTKSVYY